MTNGWQRRENMIVQPHNNGLPDYVLPDEQHPVPDGNANLLGLIVLHHRHEIKPKTRKKLDALNRHSLAYEPYVRLAGNWKLFEMQPTLEAAKEFVQAKLAAQILEQMAAP